MAWIYLIIAGLFEIGFTSALRFTEGFSRLMPTALFVACICLSFYFFEKSTRDIPVGTAYAVWCGIGAAGTTILGAAFFKEPMDFWRLFFISTLIASVVGLKLASK